MDDFSKSIKACERVLGCHVCFHDYEGQCHRFVPPHHNSHGGNAFCAATKRLGADCHCVLCDAKWVRQRLAVAAAPFCKLCHAGVIEAVLPIMWHERVAGAMFIGVFKPPLSPLPPDVVLVDPSLSQSDLSKVFKSRHHLAVPEFNIGMAGDLIAVGELLAKRLEGLIGGSVEMESTDLGPREKIERFVERGFKKQLYLADVAKHLGLSESRMTQIVRSHFGKTFPELLAERRVDHAKRLLAESFLKTETVAEECGFHDPAYFFRVFRAVTGTTPAQFRKSTQRDSLDNLLVRV